LVATHNQCNKGFFTSIGSHNRCSISSSASLLTY